MTEIGLAFLLGGLTGLVVGIAVASVFYRRIHEDLRRIEKEYQGVDWKGK